MGIGEEPVLMKTIVPLSGKAGMYEINLQWEIVRTTGRNYRKIREFQKDCEFYSWNDDYHRGMRKYCSLIDIIVTAYKPSFPINETALMGNGERCRAHTGSCPKVPTDFFKDFMLTDEEITEDIKCALTAPEKRMSQILQNSRNIIDKSKKDVTNFKIERTAEVPRYAIADLL